MQVYAIIVAIAFAIGFSAGFGIEKHRWNVSDMEQAIESGKTLQSATDRANQIAENLSNATIQIERANAEAKDKIADALYRNRKLYDSLRNAKGNKCSVSDNTRGSEISDGEVAGSGDVSGAVSTIPPEFAAECDRVLSIAHAGQEWAKAVRSKK